MRYVRVALITLLAGMAVLLGPATDGHAADVPSPDVLAGTLEGQVTPYVRAFDLDVSGVVDGEHAAGSYLCGIGYTVITCTAEAVTGRLPSTFDITDYELVLPAEPVGPWTLTGTAFEGPFACGGSGRRTRQGAGGQYSYSTFSGPCAT